MTPTETAWIAGLLEGEGCFGHKGSGTARNVTVICQMTDEDVLRKLKRLIGAGWINGPFPNGIRKDGKPCKLRWSFGMNGHTAQELMIKILPHMGKRRSSRIKKLLRAFSAVKQEKFVYLHLATGKRIEFLKSFSKRVPAKPAHGLWLKKTGLSESGLYRTLAGTRKQCRGWKRLQ